MAAFHHDGLPSERVLARTGCGALALPCQTLGRAPPDDGESVLWSVHSSPTQTKTLRTNQCDVERLRSIRREDDVVEAGKLADVCAAIR